MRFDSAVLLTLLLALGFTHPAFSEVFENHSKIELNGFGYVINSPWSDGVSSTLPGRNQLGAVFDDPFTTGETPADVLYASTSTAAAFTDTFSPDFMGAEATVLRGSTTVGNANAYWRDVAYHGGAIPGSSIRLSFTLEADLGGNIGSRSFIELTGATRFDDEWFQGANGSDDWYVAGGIYLGNIQFTDGGVIDPETLEIYSNPIFEVSNDWDNYHLINGHFIGETHFDVPYDEVLGGYPWLIGLQAQASAHYSSSFVSSMQSVGITAITDLDGNPITGVTFDSGMSSVPEVPSMYLVAGVGLILYACARLRSVRSSAAAL